MKKRRHNLENRGLDHKKLPARTFENATNIVKTHLVQDLHKASFLKIPQIHTPTHSTLLFLLKIKDFDFIYHFI